jgi:hypothetical protein
MAKQVIDTGIDGDHSVEHAGLRVGIKLNQNARLAHGEIWLKEKKESPRMAIRGLG